jgi:hypothetical protein
MYFFSHFPWAVGHGLIPKSRTHSVLQVFIPEECVGQSTAGDIRGGTSRGRLLGPSGQTIRTLQQESNCKMQIKGRGSIKLREGQEKESLANDPQYGHLQEELHVYVQYEGDKTHMGPCFSRAVKLIRVVLTGGTIMPTVQQAAINNFPAVGVRCVEGGVGGCMVVSVRGGNHMPQTQNFDCVDSCMATTKP